MSLKTTDSFEKKKTNDYTGHSSEFVSAKKRVYCGSGKNNTQTSYVYKLIFNWNFTNTSVMVITVLSKQHN